MLLKSLPTGEAEGMASSDEEDLTDAKKAMKATPKGNAPQVPGRSTMLDRLTKRMRMNRAENFCTIPSIVASQSVYQQRSGCG